MTPPQIPRRAARAVAPLALVLSLALLGGCAAGDSAEPADLVLTNGKVVTMDEALPEAEAVAMAGDRILAVGTAAEIERHIGADTEVIELAGRLVVPGFIEGHGHFVGLGQAKTVLDLTTAGSWQDIVAQVEAAAAEAAPGEWIDGRGWHQEKWSAVPEPSVDGVPLHDALSAVSPANPVLLVHASGHASFVNARALELAGIDGGTPDPAGGEIIRDAAGRPTGLLRETAQGLVRQARAGSERTAESDQERQFRRYVELAGQDALSKGVTSFHDAGSSFATIDRLKALADAGELPVRLYVMVRGESNEEMDRRLPEYRMVNHADGFLTVRSIKRQIDGALGAHGAWLLEPYDDLPTSAGLNLEEVADIEGTAAAALRHGYQVNTHAIGDRANREVLDLYERAFRAAGADGDTLRWRIEHAQHVHPDDVARFAELGVIASMQGIHATSDGPWVAKRLGEARAESGAYLWRDFLDAGVVVTNGTDVPVEDIDPIASFHATVSRRLADGSVFYPEQRLTREEALATYTINNAFAAFEEDVKGSITPGKYADLVVLSEDIMTVPESEIPGARVVLTVLGGRVVYRAEAGIAGLDRRAPRE